MTEKKPRAAKAHRIAPREPDGKVVMVIAAYAPQKQERAARTRRIVAFMLVL
jgi:hypothetical protein